MTRLNQIIAVEKSVKSRSFQELTDAHHALQKPTLLSGISRTYRPKDEEGEQLPPESTRVQVKADEVIRQTVAILTRLFDVTATKDWTNTTAWADVVVDGTPLLTQVPVAYLLFLEKQLVDLHTFVKKLPVLGASESWTYDASADSYATETVQTVRTKKIPLQPRQGRGDGEAPGSGRGVLRGTWSSVTGRRVKFSGALPAQRVNELLGRVEKLQEAVKFAREEANGVDVTDQETGEKVFRYLFS